MPPHEEVVEAPPIQVWLDGVSIEVAKAAVGDKRMMAFTHPAGWRFIVPLTDEDARTVARGLTGGIELP